MEYTSGHKVFTWLKADHKLKYINDYQSFMAKNKETTKCFIEELKHEIEANNHKVIYMLLSLGLNSGKITRDLVKYWNYCFKYRFNYDAYRNLLIQFPNKFKDKNYEIYKELGDMEFEQGKGHFIDVDTHIKNAMEYYKKINAQQEIEKCLAELQKNKINTEENYPKPIEMIIPIPEDSFNSNIDYKPGSSAITMVFRSSSNNLIYKESTIKEMLELRIIKQNIVARLCGFFQKNEDNSFDDFLDYFSFKESWFYEMEIYEIILPSLFHFYQNFKIDIKENKISMINYVLPLDSLVLKFEGIIRLFLEEKGEIIIVESKGKIEENIKLFNMLSQFEKSLENSESEKENFINLDKPFFEHIFGSEGLNLRSEIAHSFLKKKYYSHKNVIYIIDAISRIGKYQCVKQRKTTKIYNI
jgi:hypothetical protein